MDRFTQLFERYPELLPMNRELNHILQLCVSVFRSGGKLLICGNGGSAADSDHIVGELMKGFMSKRPIPNATREAMVRKFPDEGDYLADHLQGALPAISLSAHSALTTAFANDVSADMIYAQQVFGYGREGDLLLAISTSGSSLNVIRAAQIAKTIGVHVVGLTGRTGGRLKELCDIALCVPYDTAPDIQERHLPIYHALCIAIEKEMF